MSRIYNELYRKLPQPTYIEGQKSKEHLNNYANWYNFFKSNPKFDSPLTDMELFEIYRKVRPVRRAIRKVAKDLSTLPYKIVKKQLNGVEKDVTDDYPIFSRPNPYQNHIQFIQLCVLYYELNGKLGIEKCKIDDKVTCLYAIKPDNLEIIQGSEYIDGYNIITKNGNRVSKNLDDIILLIDPDPECPVKPSAKLNAARYELRSIIASMEFNLNFYSNNAVPPFAITTPEIMDVEDFGKWRQAFYDMMTGAKNAGKPLVLDGGAVVKSLGSAPLESGFLETLIRCDEGVIDLIGVPSALVNTKNVNRSNATEYTRLYYEDSMASAKELDEAFSSILPPRTRYITDFSKVPSLQKDMIKLTGQLSTQYNDNAITLNEYRKSIGREPVENGDRNKNEIEGTSENIIPIDGGKQNVS